MDRKLLNALLVAVALVAIVIGSTKITDNKQVESFDTQLISPTTVVGTAYISESGRYWYVQNSTQLNDTLEFLRLKEVDPDATIVLTKNINSTGHGTDWILIASK